MPSYQGEIGSYVCLLGTGEDGPGADCYSYNFFLLQKLSDAAWPPILSLKDTAIATNAADIATVSTSTTTTASADASDMCETFEYILYISPIFRAEITVLLSFSLYSARRMRREGRRRGKCRKNSRSCSDRSSVAVDVVLI